MEMAVEKNCLIMNELFKRARDRYYHLVNQDNIKEVTRFVENLEEALTPVL
ncbi:10600_t:CDS:1, partial [Ambispora gerdemannii]